MDELKEKELNSLVRSKVFSSKEEVIEKAIEALFYHRPELKREVAVDMYKNAEISLWKAAELSGLSLERFKQLLQERGIRIAVGEGKETSDKRLEEVFGG